MRALAGLGLIVLLLAGCVQVPPQDDPTPTPSMTPVFASEEEALAAAEEAYAAYLAVSGTVFAEGGVNAERLETVATGQFLEDELEGFGTVRENGWRSVGSTTYRDVQLQSYSPLERQGIVSIYVCEDVSSVDVIDASGTSVVAADRPPTTTMQAEFDLVSGRLVLASREAWSNEPC